MLLHAVINLATNKGNATQMKSGEMYTSNKVNCKTPRKVSHELSLHLEVSIRHYQPDHKKKLSKKLFK